MNVKTLVQIFLFLLILGIFYTFYFVYFKEDDSQLNQNQIETNKLETVKDDSTKLENTVVDEKNSNIIEKIEYKSTDRKGNEYKLEAKIGEINIKNKNIIKLKIVSANIFLVEKEPIKIFSDFAIYNTENHDTKFYDNVKIEFEDNIIVSDNFDLFIEENKAKIYNNVTFNSNISKIISDTVNIDLLTGNINVDMYNKTNKVNFLKK